MAASFQSLNHPSHALGFISRQRSQNTVRRNPVLALSPSSIIPKIEESGNLLDFSKNSRSTSALIDGGGSLLSRNSVGVIGGASVVSTVKFAKKLVDWSSKDAESSSIPFVLCSDPVLSKELLFHERSSLPFLTSKGEHRAKDHGPAVSNLRTKRIFLENSGAGCIVTPCHVSHSWYDEVAEGCSVPFLHIGECVAKELKEAKMKPLEAGSPLRIGIIASDATLAAGFYQKKLQNELWNVPISSVRIGSENLLAFIFALGAMTHLASEVLTEARLLLVENSASLLGPYLTFHADENVYVSKILSLLMQGFEVMVPDKATMEHTVLPAMEALIRKDIEGAQNLFRIALQVLLVRAVNSIILASDDMQGLLPPDDPLLKKCVDPVDALARSAIKHARSAEIAT